MKICITGSRGFIGQNLVKFYSNQNHQVFEHYRGIDLLDLLNQHHPNIIINCAAEIYNADVMWESNVVMVKTILDWCKNNGIEHFIQIGSSSEYGRKINASSEMDRLDPDTMYEGTKAAATMLCRSYSKSYDLNISVIRPYSVYGPGEKPHRLFPKLVNAFVNNDPMTLFQGYHDFIWIDDFVNGLNIVLEQKTWGYDVVNLGSGIQYSNFEVLEMFKTVSEKNPPIECRENLQKSFESSIWVCDTNHAKSQYGFVCTVDLESGVKKLLNESSHSTIILRDQG